ncbi:hypothetical protein V6D40_09760, partial [Corynebacterium sp. Q4381]|uniref:hypothetical protein n=1 Tax=Corynebacterium sp. Marseille-Q4381 TaxID=3121597 RepID=UPI002FE61757
VMYPTRKNHNQQKIVKPSHVPPSNSTTQRKSSTATGTHHNKKIMAHTHNNHTKQKSIGTLSSSQTTHAHPTTNQTQPVA